MMEIDHSIAGMILLALVLVLGLALLLPGLVRLCRWLAGPTAHGDAPDPCCAHCGYSVRKLGSFTCPECGNDLRQVGVIRPPRPTSEGNYPPVLTAMGLVLVLLTVLVVVRNFSG